MKRSRKDPADVGSRVKRLRPASLQALVQKALKDGLIDGSKLVPLLEEQEVADAAARKAEQEQQQAAALERFTDPALIGPWCNNMANKLKNKISEDWHDGYEDQSVMFSEIMSDFEVMVAACDIACWDKQYNRALAACSAIAAGLTKVCQVYSRSRNPVDEEVDRGPAVENFFFPMGPPDQRTEYLPAELEERSKVQAHLKALSCKWAAIQPPSGSTEAKEAEERDICVGCPHKVLAYIWLTAVLKPVVAAQGGTQQEAAVARATLWLTKLLRFMDRNNDWVRAFKTFWNGPIVPHPMLKMAAELGFQERQACVQAIQAAIAAHQQAASAK